MSLMPAKEDIPVPCRLPTYANCTTECAPMLSIPGSGPDDHWCSTFTTNSSWSHTDAAVPPRMFFNHTSNVTSHLCDCSEIGPIAALYASLVPLLDALSMAPLPFDVNDLDLSVSSKFLLVVCLCEGCVCVCVCACVCPWGG